MRLLHFLLLAPALLAVGCSQTAILYAPPAAHLPLSRAGEADLSILGAWSGFDARAGWSPVDRLEVFALGSYYSGGTDSAEHTFHSYQELGAGWYTRVGPSSTISLQAGYGRGRSIGYGRAFSLDTTQPAYEVAGTYNRPFVGVGFLFSRGVDTTATIEYREFGITLRVVRLTLSTTGEPSGAESSTGWLVEPAFVGRIGVHSVQLEYQFGSSRIFMGNEVGVFPLFASIGLHLQLDRLF